MNARETLIHISDWLGWQSESLSFGLRNAFDALRLYDYWQAHPDLSEMAETWDAENRIAALGYDPLADQLCHESTTSGAGIAVEAILQARHLIDSVAFIATEGDKDKPLSALNRALGLRIRGREGGGLEGPQDFDPQPYS